MEIKNVEFVMEKDKGEVLKDNFGQVKLKHGDKVIIFEQNDPFPLYPGEKLMGLYQLTVVQENKALKLRAIRNFTDLSSKNPIERVAGEEWIFVGPATYFPQIEVDIVDTIVAAVIKPNQALKLSATRDFVDRNGKKRISGEFWLHRKEGAYLPDINETKHDIVSAIVLTEQKALHVKATQPFVDFYGKQRRAGDEYLITVEQSSTHIPDVYETIVKEINLTCLTNRQWCYILNPFENGVIQWGKKKRMVGEKNFFLQPGEVLDPIGIQNIYVLSEEEALELYTLKPFEDEKKKKHVPGETFLLYGPCEYSPPIEVSVGRRLKARIQVESLGVYKLFM